MDSRADVRIGVSSFNSSIANIRAKACAYSSSVAARKPVDLPFHGTMMSAFGPPLLCATAISPAAYSIKS